MSFYKLSFAYKTEDENLDGKIVTKKQEFLAECVNYADAEALVIQIAHDYNMNAYEGYEYDIRKMPKINDIIFNEHFGVDKSSFKNSGQIFLYFSGSEYLVQVDLKITTGDNKSTKHTVFIPAVSTTEAASEALKIYSQSISQATVLKTNVLELTDGVFVTPDKYESMHTKFERN